MSFLLGSKAGQNPRDFEARQRRRSEQGGFLERLQSIPDLAEPNTTHSVDRAARHTHMKDKVHLFHNKGQYRSLHDPLPVAGHKPAPLALPAQVRHAQTPQQGWCAGQTVGALTVRTGVCRQEGWQELHTLLCPTRSRGTKSPAGFSCTFSADNG